MRKKPKYLLAHSKAKLDVFQKYLEIYLPILSNDKNTNNINIYDLFCGMGIYDNNELGSPIRAFNVIQSNQEKLRISGKPQKDIKLTINDFDKKNIKRVSEYLKNANNIDLNILLNFYNEDFEVLVEYIKTEIEGQHKKTKNFIFLDPFGYKVIHKGHVESLLCNGRTEILLFLPIAHMYRFKGKAIFNTTNPSFRPLRKFIEEFSIDISQIRGVLEFIKAVKTALSFNEKYYSLSHHIQRDKNNYYAVFFITSHIYGMQRMLGLKRKLDRECGEGFRIESFREDNLIDLVKHNILERHERARKLLKELFNKKQVVSNIDIFNFMLAKNELLPIDYTDILKEWIKESKIKMLKNNSNEKEKFLKGYIAWDAPEYIFKKVDNGTI